MILWPTPWGFKLKEIMQTNLFAEQKLQKQRLLCLNLHIHLSYPQTILQCSTIDMSTLTTR